MLAGPQSLLGAAINLSVHSASIISLTTVGEEHHFPHHSGGRSMGCSPASHHFSHHGGGRIRRESKSRCTYFLRIVKYKLQSVSCYALAGANECATAMPLGVPLRVPLEVPLEVPHEVPLGEQLGVPLGVLLVVQLGVPLGVSLGVPLGV